MSDCISKAIYLIDAAELVGDVVHLGNEGRKLLNSYLSGKWAQKIPPNSDDLDPIITHALKMNADARPFIEIHDYIIKAALEAFADCECLARQPGATTKLAPRIKITGIRPVGM